MAERVARLTTARNERDRARVHVTALWGPSELLLLQNGNEAALQSEEMRSSRKALIEAGVRGRRACPGARGEMPVAGLQLVGAYHSLSHSNWKPAIARERSNQPAGRWPWPKRLRTRENARGRAVAGRRSNN